VNFCTLLRPAHSQEVVLGGRIFTFAFGSGDTANRKITGQNFLFHVGGKPLVSRLSY
jgi:hypothetical protein